MKIAFKKGYLPPPTMALIKRCAEIVDDYMSQGYTLTVRQIFYQLVTENRVANTFKMYKRIIVVLTLGRLYGFIDWDGLVDLTRTLRGSQTWSNPQAMLQENAEVFRIDKWSLEHGQEIRPEVWLEKDALRGLIAQACGPLFCDYFSCRGYTSLSAIKEAGERLARIYDAGQTPVIVHVGDHDFSGVQMTDDVWKRLFMFAGQEVEVRRVALNMDQIKKYKLVPQFGKSKDSRRKNYVAEHRTDDVWELDALRPETLVKIIQDAVLELRDDKAWDKAVKLENEMRVQLRKTSNRWPTVSRYLKRLKQNEPKRKARRAKKKAGKKRSASKRPRKERTK